MDMSQEPLLRKNFQEKCRAPGAGTPFCASLACAVEMHMNKSQEPFYAKNARQMPPLKVATGSLREVG
jgi:hypothetical protein